MGVQRQIYTQHLQAPIIHGNSLKLKPIAHPFNLLLALMHVHVIVHMRNADLNYLNIKNLN